MAKVSFRVDGRTVARDSSRFREIATGELYVVDSWYLRNGKPPYVQTTRDWLAKKPWPQVENPDTFADPEGR